MKETFLATLGLICALTFTVQATGGQQKPQKLTAEQKALRKELLAKYDTNKDGKLDRAERAKISAEDKAKAEKAGLFGHKKGRTQTAKETK